MSSIIGNLRVVLGLDSAQFQQGLTNATAGLRRVGADMRKIGAGMSLALTAPVAGFGTMAVRVAGNFEASMNRVGAATKATGAQMDAMTALAKRLGATTQFSATQAADGIEMLAKNGLDASAILGGALQSSLTLAAASGAQLSDAADIATDVMLQFGKQAGDLAPVVDGITGVLIQSKFGIDDYRLALAQAGGVAGGIGVKFDDFNAAIAGTSSLFASGSDAGTAFKTFLQRLVPSSTAAAAKMKQLGMEFFDAQGNMKSMAEIAQELREGLDGLSDQGRNDALSTIFGTDALRTAVGLAQQGADGINRLKAAIGDTSAEEQAAARMKGFNGAMLELKSAYEALQLAIADAGLIGFVTDMVKQLTEFTLRVAQVNPELLKWGTILAGITAVIGPVLSGIGLMVLGLGPLVSGLGAVVTAMRAVGVAMLANPVGATAAAIAAAAYLIWDNWEQVGPWFARLFSGLRDYFGGFKDFVVGLFSGDLAAAVAGVERMFGGLRDFYQTLWDGIVGIFTFAWENGIKPITDALGVTDEIERGWQRLKDALSATLAAIAAAFDAAWSRIEPIIGKMASAWDKLDSLYQRASGAGRDGPISSGPYTGGATGPVLPPAAYGAGGDVAAGYAQGVSAGTGAAYDAGAELGAATERGLRDRTETRSPSRLFARLGQYLTDGLSQGIQFGADAAVDAMEDVADRTGGVMTQFRDDLKGVISSVVDRTKTLPEAFGAMLDDIARRLASSGIDLMLNSLFGALGLGGGDSLTQALRGAGVAATVPAFAHGGQHAGGWRLVGENGPEIEATGAARYFSAAQTAGMIARPPAPEGGGTVQVIATHDPGILLQIIRGEVGAAAPGIQAGAVATVSRMNKKTKNW